MNHFAILFSSKRNVVSALLVLLFSSSMSFGQDICPGADVEIATQSFSFSPSELVVDAGMTVGWVNFGGLHDVNGIASSINGASFNNPEAFSIGAMSGNAEGVCLGTFTFTIPGLYNYDCSIGSHAASGMVANITVMGVVTGCTDSLACNYDITATEDDDSCEFAEPGYDCDGNCVIDLDEDGICDTCLEYDTIVVDCACDFFDPATFTVFFIDIDEDNCIFYEDCYCECYNDADGDGICDENETSGCMNADACNYNVNSTEDDDSCVFIGDACDDEDESTVDDIIQEDCACAGTSTSIVDELEDLSVMIFPNPATSTLTITLNKKAILQVFDTTGKLVDETGVVSSWVLNVSDWEKGLYTVKTQEGKTHKFIVE